MLRMCCLLAFAIALAVVWKNPFLPMQDLPQHLFMAWVANNHTAGSLGLADIYDLRSQFGPYRVSYLLQRLFSLVVDPLVAAKMVVSVYLFTVYCVVRKIQRETAGSFTAWTSVLLVPASFHPMYFYGFMSFTLAVPLLLWLLLDYKHLLVESQLGTTLFRHLVLVVLLFLMHPYVLLVYLVLCGTSMLLLSRTLRGFINGLTPLVCGGIAIATWLLVTGGTAGVTALPEARLVFWPFQMDLRFLEIALSGMRMPSADNWLIPLLWSVTALAFVLGLIGRRLQFAGGPWLFLLAAVTLVGFFLLPFSVQTQERFSFFSVRLAPIALLILVLAMSLFRLHAVMGRVIAVAAVALTAVIALTHDRVAREVEQIVPVFENMRPGTNVLPLIANSRSAFLDPGFYAQFHYHTVFYYHLLNGGGANPDLFGNRLMPVVFKGGQRPGRPSQRELYRWPDYALRYNYIITRGVDPRINLQLSRTLQPTAQSGPWYVYRVP